MVVIEFAKSNRATCRTCNKFIDKDVMKFGTAVSGGDGYLNMEWHHENCFWDKRAGRYYKRKGKKINILLKPEQFSGQDVLDSSQVQHIHEKILECNLRWGTPQALEKAGIQAPPPAPAKQKSQGKKRRAVVETQEIDITAAPAAATASGVEVETLSKKRRSAAKKNGA